MNTSINGVSRFPKYVMEDERGRFEKFFSSGKGDLANVRWVESFSSVSKTNTVRGMHLQTPPFDSTRLISCSQGRIVDVCLDLRVGSPTFHQLHIEVLSSTAPHSLIVLPGIAHGFAAIEGPARVTYFSSAVHSEDHDTGVRWDSINFDWGIAEPIVSDRDRGLAKLSDFISPFKFKS